MQPKDVLSQVAQRYSSCDSYADEGQVAFVDFMSQPVTLLFKTNYVAPELLRFDWQDYGPERGKSSELSCLVGRDGTATVHHLGEATDTSLPLAIAGATGSSGAAASIVLPLLTAGRPAGSAFRKILDLKNTTLSDPEEIGGSSYQVLNGEWFNGDEITLWVDTGNSTLKQVSRKVAFLDLHWTYSFNSIIFDGTIDTALFQ